MPLFSEYDVQIIKGGDDADARFTLPADQLLRRGPQGERALITAKFSWGRILAAVGLLILIFVAAAYAAHDPAMTEWNKPLLNTFTVLLGGLVGIIIGEKTAGAPDLKKLLPPAERPGPPV
jgi:hypothetical protein